MTDLTVDESLDRFREAMKTYDYDNKWLKNFGMTIKEEDLIKYVGRFRYYIHFLTRRIFKHRWIYMIQKSTFEMMEREK